MVNNKLTDNDSLKSPPPNSSARRKLLLRRKERIEKQLAAMDARTRTNDRKRDTRRKIIVGAAVLAHAKRDPAFAARLHDVLKRAVARPADRAFLFEHLAIWSPAAAEATKAQRSAPHLRPKNFAPDSQPQ